MGVARKAESVMTTKGQLTVPASLRRLVGISPGDRIQFEVTGADTMTVKVRRKQDVFELLKALPDLSPSGPLDRAAINAAADKVLGDKFKSFRGGRS
jgi:AbrB family looped-hinge helix DNA binding protein